MDQGFVAAHARGLAVPPDPLVLLAEVAAVALLEDRISASAWIFIRTLVPLGVGSFVFGSIMQVPSGGVPYFVFFLTGPDSVELL